MSTIAEQQHLISSDALYTHFTPSPPLYADEYNLGGCNVARPWHACSSSRECESIRRQTRARACGRAVDHTCTLRCWHNRYCRRCYYTSLSLSPLAISIPIYTSLQLSYVYIRISIVISLCVCVRLTDATRNRRLLAVNWSLLYIRRVLFRRFHLEYYKEYTVFHWISSRSRAQVTSFLLLVCMHILKFQPSARGLQQQVCSLKHISRACKDKLDTFILIILQKNWLTPALHHNKTYRHTAGASVIVSIMETLYIYYRLNISTCIYVPFLFSLLQARAQ